ncbi:hypothetical protein E2I00_000611 [Balaenoptera physalus]|uniref:Histone H2A n=1 Tax=Balaenoptera physalus TaxID=9770 RepID=A0A6A1Q926_BALPH|nr:hypothetical protein E2I00_000611 [Balaenoptera physalus]
MEILETSRDYNNLFLKLQYFFPNMYGRGKQGGKARAKAKTRSSRGGLQFPVGRVHGLLRKGNNAERVGAGAPVYLAAVLEYLTAEILELAGNAARASSRVTGSWPSQRRGAQQAAGQSHHLSGRRPAAQEDREPPQGQGQVNLPQRLF